MADGMREKTTIVGGVVKRIWYAMTGATQGAQLLSLDDAGNLEGKLLNPVINGTATGTAVTTTGEASKIMKLGTNGEAKAQAFQLTAMNTAPASPTATGTTGEIKCSSGGIYLCFATNNWRKAQNSIIYNENLTGLTSSYTSSGFAVVDAGTKYIWRFQSGADICVLESTHNLFSGNSFYSLATGATVQTVTANSVFSFRLGNSVIYLKFDTTTGAASYSVFSGTITTMNISRTQHSLTW